MLEEYKKSFSAKDWLLLLLSSLLATWTKPSFILIMAPSIVILFLLELAECEHGEIAKNFKSLFVLGCAFVPSGLLTIYLKTVYYGDGGNSGGSGIIIGLGPLMKEGIIFHLLNIVCGLAFPILVFAFNTDRIKDRKYKLAIIMFVVGVVEWMLLHESGTRATHGNFSWGKKLGCYYVYLCAITIYIENAVNTGFLQKRMTTRTIYLSFSAILLLAAVISEMYYLFAMLRGHTYVF